MYCTVHFIHLVQVTHIKKVVIWLVGR